MLFSVDINDLINAIHNCNIGWKLGTIKLHIIVYADDFVILP